MRQLSGSACIAALVVALIVSIPVSADTRFPALYDVTGVVSGDALNVRQAPSTSAAIIATLPRDRTSIEVVGLSADGRWANVGLAEGSGWAALRYLAPQPSRADGRLPVPMRCSGTEPFWHFDLPTDDRAELSRPSGPAHSFDISWQGTAEGRTDHELAAVLDGGGGPAVLTVAREYCSDGMSDRTFGLSARLLILQGDTPAFLSGCCSLVGP